MPVSFKPVFVYCKVKFKGTKFGPCISFVFNNGCNSPVRKLIMHARLLLFCRLYHCVPDAAFLVDCIKKHKFSFASGSFFNSINSSSTNSAVIKNHKCSRFNQIRQVIHHMMFNFTGNPVQKHKFILSAYSTWMLSNKFFR